MTRNELAAAEPPARPSSVLLAALGTSLVLLALYSVGVAFGILSRQPAGIDFLPLWTAARVVGSHPDRVYDFSYITDAQNWALAGLHKGERPFAYPPTMLLYAGPFGTIPFDIANTLWTGIGALAAMLAAWFAAPARRWLAAGLFLLAPPFMIAVAAGQTTLVLSALLIAGVCNLDRRPWLAGALIGIAATIKPNLVALAPILLLISGRYRALAAAIPSGTSIGALAILLFGPSLWPAWLEAATRFGAQTIARPNFLPEMISPASAAVALGLPSFGVSMVHWLFAGVSLVCAALIWRRSKSWPPLLISLVAGGLMIGSYAMSYDATALGAASAAMAVGTLGRPRWYFGLGLFALYAGSSEAYVGPYVLVLQLALVTLYTMRGEPQPGLAQAFETHGSTPLRR